MRPSAPDQWPQVSARQLRMGRVAGQQQQACNCRECECPKAGSGQAGLAVTTATVCEDHTKWETSRQESHLIVTSNVLIAHWCMLDIRTQQTQMGCFFDGISGSRVDQHFRRGDTSIQRSSAPHSTNCMLLKIDPA